MSKSFKKFYIPVLVFFFLFCAGISKLAASPDTLRREQTGTVSDRDTEASKYLDGVRYVYANGDMKPLLIEDFLHVAFARVPWPYQEEFGIGSLIDSLNPSSREGKWYWQGIVQDGEYPNLEGIVRWDINKVIDVIIDGDPQNPDSRQRLLSAVQAVLPDLTKKSGLKFQIVEREGRNDFTGAIVIRDPVYTGLMNKYKVWRPQNGVQFSFDMPWIKIAFTTETRAQPAGYIFPRHDNIINYALCYVLSDLNGEMVHALTTECLLRSLGLPGVAISRPVLKPLRSFLLEWNKIEGENSKTIYLDEQLAKNKLEYTNKGVPPRGEEIVPDIIKDFVFENRISDFDEKMLKILYCPDIKPGMSRIKVLETLVNSNACFE